MQGKVSMVMPCYNKDEYIGEMFDSIMNQEWDNIELILVNDGSTDRTREVIDVYEPRFRARGFEVAIIDQKNAGVCAATKTGLQHVTGEYVCVVDADDELDPQYVSTMAGWLDEHREYDYCMCGAAMFSYKDGKKEFLPYNTGEVKANDLEIVEQYLNFEMNTTVWMYMTRMNYVKKCRIIETYYTTTRGSHEPGYVIPLLAYKGSYKYFSASLYHFHIDIPGHSRPQAFAQFLNYKEEYIRLGEIAIDALPNNLADPEKKVFYKQISAIAQYKHLYTRAARFPNGEENEKQAFIKLFRCYYDFFSLAPPVNLENTIRQESFPAGIIMRILTNCMIVKTRRNTDGAKGRIVAWGVLGTRGQRLLPLLKGTPLEPTEFWDTSGDGSNIKKPDITTLHSNDVVLVLPINAPAMEIQTEISKKNCMVLLSWQIDIFIKFLESKKGF